MKYRNQISTKIDDHDLSEIIDAIKFINDKLPKLITLTNEELCALPKMQENTIDFVLSTFKDANQNPMMVPEYVDIKEIMIDVELIKSIEKILKPLRLLMKKLEDSKTLAGSEAYLPSIAIYNAFKAADLQRRHPAKVSTSKMRKKVVL